MRRTTVALGILGLVWAVTAPAFAQKQIKIFGKTYTVIAHKRVGTYKNGKKVSVTDNGNKHAYTHRHSNSDADTDGHRDTNGYADTKAYSYSEGYSNPKGSADSTSKALGFTVISGSWITWRALAGIAAGEESRF